MARKPLVWTKRSGTHQKRRYRPYMHLSEGAINLSLSDAFTFRKSDGKTMRPLGIPTMEDRAQQALHLLALDPVVETTADNNSYGFRQQRSCADAIVQCF